MRFLKQWHKVVFNEKDDVYTQRLPLKLKLFISMLLPLLTRFSKGNLVPQSYSTDVDNGLRQTGARSHNPTTSAL